MAQTKGIVVTVLIGEPNVPSLFPGKKRTFPLLSSTPARRSTFPSRLKSAAMTARGLPGIGYVARVKLGHCANVGTASANSTTRPTTLLIRAILSEPFEQRCRHERRHQRHQHHQREERGRDHHGIPAQRAAIIDPPNFPAMASTMIAPQMSHISAPLTRAMLVRRPANAK